MEAIVYINAAPKYKIKFSQIEKLGDGRISSYQKELHEFCPDFLPDQVDQKYNYYFLDPLPPTIILKEDCYDNLKHYSNTFFSSEVNFNLEQIRQNFDKIYILDYLGYHTVSNFLFKSRGYYNTKELYFLDLDYKITDLSKPRKYYNLFSGQKVGELSDQENPDLMMTRLKNNLEAYIKCGFHEEKLIDTYIMTRELVLCTPEMDLFLRYFNLYPHPEDQREEYQENFMSNPQYRKIVTKTLAKIILEYSLNNKKPINPIWEQIILN